MRRVPRALGCRLRSSSVVVVHNGASCLELPQRHGPLVPVRHLSSTAAVSQQPEDDAVGVVSSLKNMVKPFFLKCHPDVQSTVEAKRINLQALQKLNGFLDILEATCCHGKIVEWPDTILEIEFVIVLEERVKKDLVETSSRRKVELTVPPQALRDAVVQQVPPRDAVAIQRLQHHVRLEFAKLLKVAGLPVPVVLEDDSLDTAWEQELDFLDDTTIRTREFKDVRRQTRYEMSRERFVKSVDWNRIQRLCKEAEADMEADLATENSIRSNAKRRQQVITNILSKVRVAEEIPALDQLIAFRRLSLILEDNFDELQMEDMGRMWEHTTLVLTPERDYSTSSSSLRKRAKRSLETGFSFSYGANGIVTIHVPIDFTDEELVKELNRNLWDFYNLVGDGVEDLYPRWFTE